MSLLRPRVTKKHKIEHLRPLVQTQEAECWADLFILDLLGKYYSYI